MSINLILIFSVMLMCSRPVLAADEETPVKATTTQNVGGLLFDVDEGVKIEKGPGGSVYVKSNREYMQEKFAEIDAKLAQFETRISQLEKDKGKSSLEANSESASGTSKVLVS